MSKLLLFVIKNFVGRGKLLTDAMGKLKSKRYENLVNYLYQPTDSASLGAIRFLFGLLMAIDVIEERGGSEIDIRWGHPEDCHFPLFSVIRPLPYPYMCLVYGIMWIGAIGIMLGFRFRTSTFLFAVPYWYLMLLDKSFWNNHSYLYGIVVILLMGSSANHFLSVDGILDQNLLNKPVPYWNYFILKYQFFMLYFLAGLKKTDSEWLDGYSMKSLGGHWVFLPFSVILSTEQIEYLVVHWFGFILDLTIGFWMLLKFSRPVAMVSCAMFHLMNSRLFNIGMFPYVCLATLPLFCKEDWPKVLWRYVLYHTGISKKPKVHQNNYCKINGNSLENNEFAVPQNTHVKFKQKFVIFLVLTHMGLQAFLPYSHFITKGYNNWTNGLYGYSWDMMVHSWETVLVVVKVVDNQSGEQFFINTNAWSSNERWTKHGDMCLQYAQCVKANLESSIKEKHLIPTNLSIYIDVWSSLNKRFQQRMYDPNYDLMTAKWSPFRPVEWLLPLLTEYNGFRRKMDEINSHVHSWSNESDVMFVADFPGMSLENYISEGLSNVSLTVLEGEVVFEMENDRTLQTLGTKLGPGDSIAVLEGYQHRVHTISKTPSCYMYTFSKADYDEQPEDQSEIDHERMYSPFPLIEDMSSRKEGLVKMLGLIWNATLHLLFEDPLDIRR